MRSTTPEMQKPGDFSLSRCGKAPSVSSGRVLSGSLIALAPRPKSSSPKPATLVDAEVRRTCMLLGIDVGTGGTRAVLVDRAGRVVASAPAEHAAIRSDHIGWAEQDPDDWWRAARQAIPAAIAAANLSGAQIHALALTGQMHGCVMLDAEGSVLRPALIWCDQRTQPECDWLRSEE